MAEAKEQQQAAIEKRNARDAACWGDDDDEKPESFLQGPSFNK